MQRQFGLRTCVRSRFGRVAVQADRQVQLEIHDVVPSAAADRKRVDLTGGSLFKKVRSSFLFLAGREEISDSFVLLALGQSE